MTIDGKDIYKEWGCTLLEGSFDDLLKYPKRKSVTFRNWAEADGIDPDLSVVEFEARTVKLSFLMEAIGEAEFWHRYRKFAADMSAPGYREFGLIAGTTNRMRLNAGTKYELPIPPAAGKNVSSFDLNFVEDTHSIYPVAHLYGGINLRGQLAINGIDFGEFGIGCDDDLEDILKTPAMKAPFTDGRTMDLSTIKVKHQEIKLSLWMMACSVEEFLNNYRAFFHQLTGLGNQELYINTLDGIVQVYYSDCPSYKVEIWDERQIATRFTISLVAPVVSWVDAGGDTRWIVLRGSDTGLLADEEGRVLVFN
jgi:hypothetical protein